MREENVTVLVTMTIVFGICYIAFLIVTAINTNNQLEADKVKVCFQSAQDAISIVACGGDLPQ
jgi:hypothetical protein